MIKKSNVRFLFSVSVLAIICLAVVANAKRIPAKLPDPDDKPGDADKPLKVYILAGQSNMEGHAKVSTFEHIGMDPKTAPMLEEMLNKDGTPKVCNDVYISYMTGKGGWGKPMKPAEKQGKLTVGFGSLSRGPKIGPEYTFGIYMHKKLKEPILLIKTAWGGKSLHTDFRPPSAGPYEWNSKIANRVDAERKEQKKKNTGKYYRLMVDYVNKVLADPGKVHPAYNEDEGYEIAGFVWFQGFNDMVDSWTYPNRTKPDGYKLYTELLCHFIRDVRKDINAPDMPFVIGVIGVGGVPTKESEAKKAPRYRGIAPNIRKAMAAPADMPEFKDSVAAVYTGKYWDTELDELINRMHKQVRQKVSAEDKKNKLSREEKNKLTNKLTKKAFTEKQLKILNTGKSNQGYHYYGSAKILGQIGKAFADAMVKLNEEEPATTSGIIDVTQVEPPDDAVVLVGEDGYDLVPENDKVKCLWKFEDGVLTASPKWDSLITKKTYKDFRMHLEFNVNNEPDEKAEGNGNSGVYIQQRYEIQILNSYGVSEEDYKPSYCGSLYRLKKPDKIVCKPSGQWQSYDIAFRAARFDGDKKVENARITVYHNGELVHDDFSIPRKTGVGKKEGPEPRPIKLQGHHNEVKFRNVWVQELNL